MAYQYIDAAETRYPGPSINGWRQVKLLMQAFQDWPRPALEQLIEHGYTNMLPALSVECNALANKTADPLVQHTLQHLASVALKADEIVALEH